MRIAIVNDVASAVEILRRTLSKIPGCEVAWTARNGSEAVQRCTTDTPDLVLMDLVMPVMDGVEATRQIMAKAPCAILVVTATVLGHAPQVFEALGAGALDAITTPALVEGGGHGGIEGFVRKLNQIRGMLQGRAARAARERGRTVFELQPESSPQLVGLGASAGGPAALATVLAGLPKDFPAAVVIIQHLDPRFAALLASWLTDQSHWAVRLAVGGERPRKGTVLLAGTADHLVVRNGNTVLYTPEPRACVYRPSVDAFFESMEQYWKGEMAAVLLTGMGRDGAAGMRKLRATGALTIAQDEASSAVYGMPKAAAKLNAAAKILPLDRIAPSLVEHFAPGSRARNIPSSYSRRRSAGEIS